MKEQLLSLVSRKFLLAVLALIFAFILVATKVVLPGDFLDFTKWVLGIFTVGNAVVDTAGIIKGE